MAVTLDDDARRYLARLEEVTGATGQDCILVGEETDSNAENADTNTTDEHLLIVVTRGEMSEAIGPGGQHVQQFEDDIGKPVRLIEAAETPADFVANALAPAAVYNVTISENDDTVAYVEVADEDRGVAIGKHGRTIDAARTLANRHFGIDDVQLA